MNRNEVPTWALTKPGEYETRDGSKAVVEFRSGCPNGERRWVGYVVGLKGLYVWADDGSLDPRPDIEIIGPWIEGGLPFDCVLDPATADADLLRRFNDASKAGVEIDFKGKSSSNQHWCMIRWPYFNGLCVYRLRGSTADWTQPQPMSAELQKNATREPVPLSEHQRQQVCDIVAAAFDKWSHQGSSWSSDQVAQWMRAGMPADWRPEQ